MIIRLLDRQDVQSWKNIRLEALHNEPQAFCISFEQEARRSDSGFKTILDKNTIFGVFVDGELVGSSGFYILDSLKTRHRGVLWGMYVKQEHRRKGIADLLIQTIITHAKSHVIQLNLTVIASNTAAIKLYQRHGFIIYATEPRSLKLGDQFFDEHYMILKFM